MAKDPSEQSTGGGSAEMKGFSQNEIDALFSEETEAAPSSAPTGAGSAQNASPTAAGATASGGSGEADAAGEIDQASIDALLAQAGGESDAPKADPPAEAAEPDKRVDSSGRPFDEVAAAMQAAIDEDKAGSDVTPPVTPVPLDLPDLKETAPINIDRRKVAMLNDVSLRVKIQLGRTRMLVEDVLALDTGSVVELDRIAGDPVDILVNDRLIARGEVLVLNDNFCVRVSEVLANDPHRVSA